MVEMWDVAAAMSTLLARAQARTSLGCTNHHGIRAKTVPQTSGTRTGISLEVLAIFLAKILSILCWHACAFLLVEVKRSAQTKSSPVDVGRRLNAVDFVCFIALFEDASPLALHPLRYVRAEWFVGAVGVEGNMKRTMKTLTDRLRRI